jgi:hypothetical protein
MVKKRQFNSMPPIPSTLRSTAKEDGHTEFPTPHSNGGEWGRISAKSAGNLQIPPRKLRNNPVDQQSSALELTTRYKIVISLATHKTHL